MYHVQYWNVDRRKNVGPIAKYRESTHDQDEDRHNHE